MAAGSPLTGWAPSWTSSFLCCSLPALPSFWPGPWEPPHPAPSSGNTVSTMQGGGTAPRGPVGVSWSCVCNTEKVGDGSRPFQLRLCCCSLALRALRLRVGWSHLYSTQGSLLSHLQLLQRDTATRMLALARQEGRQSPGLGPGSSEFQASGGSRGPAFLRHHARNLGATLAPPLPVTLLCTELGPRCPALNLTSLTYQVCDLLPLCASAYSSVKQR